MCPFGLVLYKWYMMLDSEQRQNIQKDVFKMKTRISLCIYTVWSDPVLICVLCYRLVHGSVKQKLAWSIPPEGICHLTLFSLCSMLQTGSWLCETQASLEYPTREHLLWPYSQCVLCYRLVHGSVKHKLAWSTPTESISFDPILIVFYVTDWFMALWNTR